MGSFISTMDVGWVFSTITLIENTIKILEKGK
jgi:hypothetical protein